MKFPISMLRDFVRTGLDAVQVGDLLTMAGFELEGIEEVEGEHVLDIKVVSNRGDGLSVFGLAREVLARDASSGPTDLYLRAADRFPMADSSSRDVAGRTDIQIETEACTRYACRIFDDVTNGNSPEWLQQRIRQAGMRPISLLVDLTNYVMLELGQPLHAFDFEKLRGGRIVVRDARPGEELTTLNGEQHKLQPGQMMICDAEGPVAVAGVMGGAASEVEAGTTTVLLESAHFVNTSVRRTRKQLGLSTEASYRFERSVDHDGVVAALNRFAELFEQCGGGRLVPGVLDMYPAQPRSVELKVRMSRATRLLGMEVPAEHASEYLRRLGFGVSGDGEPFHITAPTWRPDIQREDDVVEEIGRVHGYDHIPETPLQGTTLQGGVFGRELLDDLAREAVVRNGFIQTISHSLRDLHPLDSPGERIGPRNPGSPEMAYLRNSLWPSLADAAKRNGGRDLHLFELGRVFGSSSGTERVHLALLSQGALLPQHWVKSAIPSADFYSVKGVVQDVLAILGAEVTFEPGSDPRLHPARQAQIVDASGSPAGVFGQIHPDVADEMDLPADTVLAQMDLHALSGGATKFRYQAISRNPAVRRDLAILIGKDVPYERIGGAIQEAGGEMLERQWLFDVYEGKGIPEGSHSLAIAMLLRKKGENLTDEEANQVRDRVAQALVELGATQR